MHDWWSPLIGMIIGFLFAWGVFELTEHRRRNRAQAAIEPWWQNWGRLS